MDVTLMAADCLPVQALTTFDVHVWHASLEQPAWMIKELGSILSDEETQRANRFHFEQHRRFYIAGRGILRTLLSSYTGIKPDKLKLQYTPYGKPYLTAAVGGSEICFNLSHSDGLVIYAFTCGRQVGIDVERIRPIEEMDQIAERNFSPEEYNRFRAVSEADRLRAFFNCWTRKEAFIKATGEGISFPLQKFDVSLEPGYPAQLMNVLGSGMIAKRWSMHDLRTMDGFAAALVVEGNDISISQQQWMYPWPAMMDGFIA